MYEDEVNDNAGFEQSSDPAPIAEQSPAQDEWIQPEDFPWEKGEREEARTSTTTPDPDDSQQQEVDPTARTEEAAPSGQEEDKTDEEKKLDEEIQRLQAENPTGLPKHLRSVAQGALRGKRNAEAQVAELTQQLESQSNTLFRPTLPAEEFVAQGKPKEFWDNIAKEYPGYYEPMVNDVLRAHLDPQRLQANPDSAPPVLFDIFANQWLPDFLQQTFGLDAQGFSNLLAQHRAGGLQSSSPFSSQGQQPFPSVAQITPQAIAEKFGWDVELDKEAIEFLASQMSIAAQVPKLQSAIQALQTNSVSGTKQQEEAATNERLATLDQMINADRQSLLDKAMGTLPRDARGQIKPEFAHLPQKIARLVKVALDEDANYTAARDHTRKWFKQPGNVETAKSLAGGDLKKIYGTHQNVITQIVKEELAPYVGKLRAQSQYQQTQAARQMPKGGTSPDLAPPVPQSVNGRHPTDLRSRAQARFQQTRQGAL